MEQQGVRINKYIADSGLCSRREADTYISEGKVRLNGKKAKMGDRVMEGDSVSVNGKEIGRKKEKHVYIALNKPAGIVCTADTREEANVIDFVGHPRRIFPIGRLDKVASISFSAKRARANKQKVLYVTERCVFELGEKGLRLIEVYPGVDMENDILSLLPFPVEIDPILNY